MTTPTVPDPDNRDSLKIEGSTAKPVKNIVIDHCSFSWAIDEIASAWGPHDNITFSNNIFAEPLNESLHPAYTGSGVAEARLRRVVRQRATAAASPWSATCSRTSWSAIRCRAPASSCSSTTWSTTAATMDLDLQSQDGVITKSSVVGNVFLRGPSFARDTRPIYVRTTGSLHAVPRQPRLRERQLRAGIDQRIDRAHRRRRDLGPACRRSTMPVWNTGLTARATANNAVYNRVLQYAGARPTDRDSVDKRIVQSVKSRNGQVINCVSSERYHAMQQERGRLAVHMRRTRAR